MKTRRHLPAVAGFLSASLLLLSLAPAAARDWPQWRGPQRDGISQEKGLLPQWPAGGPKLLWQARQCGAGYATPAIVGERIYLLGNEGLENEFVLALSARDGQRVWQTRLGNVGNPAQQPKFPAARSTPTVDGKLLYALGSDGDLACLETATGKLRWRKSLRADFGGKPGTWAYAESPLVDGSLLVCTPGGTDATLVALNKKSGALVWKCSVSGGGDAAYASPIAVQVGGVRQYVQVLQKGLVGVAAKTGQLLWRFDKTVSRYDANIPTPVFHDGHLYAAGAGTGGAILRLKAGGGSVEAEQVAFSPKLPTAIGGSIALGGHLYGTGGKAMLCVVLATGEVKWEESCLAPAALCYADGRFYLHGENGEVALVEATPAGCRELGRFTPPDQPKRSQDMEKPWAYPVVANGRLYLRDHDSLWCYDLKAGR